MSRPSRKDEITGLSKASKEVVYPHIFPNADREVGGVLVGRSPKDGGLPMITGAIEAISADEQRATLTFTQDSWEHVHSVMDKRFPDDEIVGWYHSHPNFGIFLSDHDLFIHRNFFDGPSQIALVVDPCNQTEGVFVWNADGDIEKLYERATPKGWAAPEPEPVVVPQTPGPMPQSSGPKPNGTQALVGSLTEGQAMGYAAAGIGGVLLGLLLAMGFSIGATTTTVVRPLPTNPNHGKDRWHHKGDGTTTTSKPTTSSSASTTTTSSSTTSTSSGKPATLGATLEYSKR